MLLSRIKILLTITAQIQRRQYFPRRHNRVSDMKYMGKVLYCFFKWGLGMIRAKIWKYIYIWCQRSAENTADFCSRHDVVRRNISCLLGRWRIYSCLFCSLLSELSKFANACQRYNMGVFPVKIDKHSAQAIGPFYARQLYRQVLLRARISYGNSVCPSVRHGPVQKQPSDIETPGLHHMIA